MLVSFGSTGKILGEEVHAEAQRKRKERREEE